MTSHPVKCGNKTAIQSEGGAIGLDLTCVVAKSVMQCLDDKLVHRLNSLGFDCTFNKTYVDDKTLVTSVALPGLRYQYGQVTRVDTSIEEDSLIQPDRRTSEIVRQVASDLFGCLKFTSDCPSSNQNGKMPVLDLSV